MAAFIDPGTINIISEHFLEAANATSVNAPYGVSEWALSGLTPAPSTTVQASRVKESIFSIEGKVGRRTHEGTSATDLPSSWKRASSGRGASRARSQGSWPSSRGRGSGCARMH